MEQKSWPVNISLAEARDDLERLCARAQAGEEVVITLGGARAVRLTPVAAKPEVDLVQRRRKLLDDLAEAGRKATPGPCAARSQDFLYDEETGLPA